ncbi:hypothetical protein [Amycolatopsis anabasis]|uniref:hypothetical protein n=1 Tax=Amycolatopsis anabasis TaxID=1840409 RepID=UPI00131ADC36|nr:hypothetical protein [Amycolatopsis anabasis]
MVGHDGPNMTGQVVYGVWLRWGLLYVGQTANAERRLRDLPVGESHHLANTFPPEIWHRVVVVAWPRLPEAAHLPSTIDPNAAGLALEYRLQAWLRPLVNASRRTTEGGWRDVNWQKSRSTGARAAGQIDGLFAAVQRAWQKAATSGPNATERSGIWRVVSPSDLLDQDQQLPTDRP